MLLALLPLAAGAAFFASPQSAHATVSRSTVVLLDSGYRVRLSTPLGIAFEECTVGAAEGVVVADLVEGGNAMLDGRVLVGDKLIKCTAVTFGGEGALVTVGVGQQFTMVA